MDKKILDITDKAIDYISNLILDSDIAETKEEVYTALGVVTILMNEFVKKELGHNVIIIERKKGE